MSDEKERPEGEPLRGRRDPKDHPEHGDWPESATDVPAMHAAIAREYSEPRDGHEPLPVWLVLLAFGLVGWGGWYLGTYSGNFRGDVYYPTQLTLGVERTAEPVEIPLEELGPRVYQNNCSSCHQADGAGVAGSLPPLANSDWVAKPQGILVRLVLDGLQGPMVVDGTPYDGVMPAWRDRLDDREIAAVLTYVRQSFGNQAPPVAPGYVAGVREATADHDGQPWSPDALLAIEAEIADEGVEDVLPEGEVEEDSAGPTAEAEAEG